MSDSSLRGCRVLVVEDEYLLAIELEFHLAEAGAIVLGPAGTMEDAVAIIDAEPAIDGAILDVNLGGETRFTAADMLLTRGVPFLFTTGYDGSIFPPRFADIVRCEKPITVKRVTEVIDRLIHA